MLKFTGVRKSYKNESFTLSGIDFEIQKGEFVFLTGRTGAGKTTLIKMIYGAQRPEEGMITIEGKDITRIRPRELQKVRRRLGLVFQDHGLIDDKTVYDNIAYPLYISSCSRETVKKRVSIALRLVDLAAKKDMFPEELSGGEKQKVCIARALVADPQIIVADEPTGNIDEKATAEIMDLLWEINKKGVTMLIATHDMKVVSEFGGRVIELQNGRILKDAERRILT